MNGLIIKKEPMDEILSGRKTWEIRGSRTTLRGPIALIQSKSGCVVGRCRLVDVVGPLSIKDMQDAAPKHRATGVSRLPYKKTYAWVLKDARRLRKPIPYRHRPGAVIWVKLSDSLFAR